MTKLNNKPVVVFDNIGSNFIAKNNNFIILGAIEGYQTLSREHVGYYIPYLAKCVSVGKTAWELGIGYVDYIDSQIVVNRIETTASSQNSSESIDFELLDGNKYFYIFVNANRFNTGLNNVLLRNSDFDVEPVNSLYIVDASTGLIHASMPDPVANTALEIRFRRVGSSDGRLFIVYNNSILSSLVGAANYTCFISDGSQWVELNSISKSNNLDIQSLNGDSNPTFFAQSQTSGAIPYNNDGILDSTNIFWGDNKKLLFGSTQESDAHHILPTSGNYSTVVNNDNTASDFIVYGSGNTSNLYFSKDGRLGLNMPTGTNGNNLQPITLLHLVNTFCRDAIRVDNRSDCYPASINLYHRPVTDSNIQNDREIGKLTISSVTSDKVYTTFANIVGKSKSISPGASKGQLEINVNNGSPLGTVTTISTNSDETKLGYNNSNVTIGSSSVNINSSSVALNGNVFVSGNITTNANSSVSINDVFIGTSGRVTLGSIYVNDSGIPVNKLLAIGNDRKLYAATGLNFGLSPNKIVTTDASGTLVSTLNSSSYLATGPDMTWNKYSARTANICLKQLTFVDAPTIDEFAIGDQIAMVDNNGNYLYRYINQLSVNGNSITSLILDQDVGLTASTSVSVISVSRGGYLMNQVSSSGGPPSDATYIRLSTRPGLDTIFNGNRKNINFSVYSTEDTPTLKILSNASTVPLVRGQYFRFATQVKLEDGFQSSPVSSLVGSDLSLPSNTSEQNSVTYNFSSVSKQATGKSSFYGTFDQNGNAFEWVENTAAFSNDRFNSWNLGTQYICGGSWKTNSSEKLRSIIPESYTVKKPDIGFRICKRYGYSSNNSLGIGFSSVADIDNPPDNTSLYKEGSEVRYGESPEITEANFISIPNLGRVNHIYDISSYEITNSQYLAFLQSIDPTAENASEYYVTTNAYENNSKGIVISNNTYTLTDSKYSNAPVVYISYLNAIRFINWLHNGSLSYAAMTAIADASDSETIANVISRNIGDGAYSISIAGGSISIFKNKDQKYWLPSLNEWHKAAYYRAGIITEQGGTSAITIKSDAPKEISTGKLASVTVGGPLYTDSLVVGTYDDVNNVLKTTIDSTNNYNIIVGTSDLVTVPDTQVGAGTYGTFISNTGIVLAANGTIKIVCANSNNSNIFELNPTGVIVPKLTIGTGDTKTVIDGGTITKVETTTNSTGGTSTNNIEQYEGPISGVIYKFSKINDDQTVTIDAKSSDAIIVSPENSAITLKKSAPGNIIYANENTGYMEGHSKISYLPTVEGLGAKVSGVLSLSSGQAIDVPMIRIGPTLESYKGRILTHNGNDVAEWGPSDFLRADGVTYNRFIKRAVTFSRLDNELVKNQFSFTDLGTDKGGTGPITLKVMINGQEQTLSGIDAIKHEFDTADTIAIYSPTNQIHYAKVRTTIFQGGDILDTAGDVANASYFSNESTLTVLFGPPVPWTAEDVKIKNADGSEYYLGYVFSIQKGSYLDMDIEPEANYRFDETGRNDTSYRGFKPSTANTLSIRPTIHTAFNKVAEDIDFAIYGYRNTLYKRYEDWFNRDDSGLPTGIIPAFYVNAKLENSFEGSIASGIFRSSITIPKADDNVTLLPDQIFAKNVFPDLSPKVCINTKNPYPVTSLTGIYRGKIFGKQGQIAQDEITYGLQLLPSGYLASGTSPLTKYADLTVSGYLYSNNIIVDDIYLNYDKKVPRPKYITNAPLTVNQFGQVVSIIPPAPPAPPSSPRSITVDQGNDGVTLYWKTPIDDGRSTIFSYITQYSSDGGVNWTEFKNPNNDDTPSDLFVFIPKISDSTKIGEGIGEGSYRFRNYAINYEGSGTYSNIVGPYAVNNNVSSTPKDLTVARKLDQNDDGTYKYITETILDDGFTIERSTNPTISWNSPEFNGSAAISQYTIDYASAYDFDPITETLTPVKELSWTAATVIIGTSERYTGNVPATVDFANGLVLQNILSDFTYYFRIRAYTIGKGYGTPSIIKSVGTRAEPAISKPATEEEDWDFGITTFNGGCS